LLSKAFGKNLDRIPTAQCVAGGASDTHHADRIDSRGIMAVQKGTGTFIPKIVGQCLKTLEQYLEDFRSLAGVRLRR
jgi:hypothetical protein